MGDFLKKFGDYVGNTAQKDPIKARKILQLAFEAKKIQLKTMPGKKLLPSKKYVALMMMDSMLHCLRDPQNAVMVSLFVPCEPLHALGLHPYSVEGFSAYLTGAWSQKFCLDYASHIGVPETFCSYHRIFLGAAEKGVMPRPRFIIHTNLACDANQITFRRMEEHYQVPHFSLDIPYAQNEEAVVYVAEQLRRMTEFINEVSGQKIEAGALRSAIRRSRISIENYKSFLQKQKDHYICGDITSEMYASFAYHPLLGTEETEKFSKLCLSDAEQAPPASGIKLLWLHTIPFWQPCVRQKLNFNPNVYIAACDMSYEGLIKQDEDRPYESMARRLVYSPFNSGADCRIRAAEKAARLIEADGIVYFCHWGCKETLGSAQLIKKELESQGFPTLILDGDGCDPQNSSDGQVETRLDAFIEMLEERKK